MAATQSDLDELKKARARGVRRVRQGNEEVEYQTFSDLNRAIEILEAELTGTALGKPTITYPKTSRGL